MWGLVGGECLGKVENERGVIDRDMFGDVMGGGIN